MRKVLVVEKTAARTQELVCELVAVQGEQAVELRVGGYAILVLSLSTGIQLFGYVSKELGFPLGEFDSVKVADVMR